MTPTITLDEANRKLDAYIEQAVAQLPPGAKLKERLRIEEEACDDVAGDEVKQHASRNYEVTGIESENIPSYFQLLRDWLKENNFRVLEDKANNEFLWVENSADSFRMTLKTVDQNRLILISSSPCVWRNGTPE